MTEIQSAVYQQKSRVTSYAKDVYLMMLTGIFSQTHTEYKWDPDPELSALLISDRMHAPDDNEGMKPMIYLSRGRMAYSKSAINQMSGMDFESSSESYSDLIQGTMIINCVSSEGLEAEDIASMIFTALQAFKQDFNKLGFHSMEVNELLEERPVDTKYDSKLVEVPVITTFTFQYSWCKSTVDLQALQDICIQRKREADTEIDNITAPYDAACEEDENGAKCRSFAPAPDKVRLTLDT